VFNFRFCERKIGRGNKFDGEEVWKVGLGGGEMIFPIDVVYNHCGRKGMACERSCKKTKVGFVCMKSLAFKRKCRKNET